MKKTEQPKTELIECASGNRERTTHPAFGVVFVSRTSGQTKLFESEFSHQSYITLRISTASVDRKLCRNWVHRDKELIDVCLSEAQWATMLSSMNLGEGTPCTLQYVMGESIPAIGEIESSESMHTREFDAHMSEVNNKLEDLQRQIAEAKMTNKLKSTLLDAVRRVDTAANSNLKFVANSFAEHIETTVEQAKIEITSFARVAGMDRAPLEIDDKKPEPVVLKAGQ